MTTFFTELAPLNHRAALLAELDAAKRERQRLAALIAGLEFCLQCPYCGDATSAGTPGR